MTKEYRKFYKNLLNFFDVLNKNNYEYKFLWTDIINDQEQVHIIKIHHIINFNVMSIVSNNTNFLTYKLRNNYIVQLKTTIKLNNFHNFFDFNYEILREMKENNHLDIINNLIVNKTLELI